MSKRKFSRTVKELDNDDLSGGEVISLFKKKQKLKKSLLRAHPDQGGSAAKLIALQKERELFCTLYPFICEVSTPPDLNDAPALLRAHKRQLLQDITNEQSGITQKHDVDHAASLSTQQNGSVNNTNESAPVNKEHKNGDSSMDEENEDTDAKTGTDGSLELLLHENESRDEPSFRRSQSEDPAVERRRPSRRPTSDGSHGEAPDEEPGEEPGEESGEEPVAEPGEEPGEEPVAERPRPSRRPTSDGSREEAPKEDFTEEPVAERPRPSRRPTSDGSHQEAPEANLAAEPPAEPPADSVQSENEDNATTKSENREESDATAPIKEEAPVQRNFTDFERKTVQRAETATEKANDLFYAYYNQQPYKAPEGKLALTPYQMLLSVVASPQISIENQSNDSIRPCHQLFATSTGSGKTLALLNSVWQYASFIPDDGHMFTCYIIAPPSAKKEIIDQMCYDEQNNAVEGLHRYVRQVRSVKESRNKNKKKESAKESRSKDSKKESVKEPRSKDKKKESKTSDICVNVSEALKQRGILFLNYREFVQIMIRKKKSADPTWNAKYGQLFDFSQGKPSPRIGLFFDEAHALVDTSATDDPVCQDADCLARVRQRISETQLGCCMFFTWTFITKSVTNAVTLMLTLRGQAWASSKGIASKDWNRGRASNQTGKKIKDCPPLTDKKEKEGVTFFVIDKEAQEYIDDICKQLKQHKCPPLEISRLPRTALTMTSKGQSLFYEACLDHVFYLDVSKNIVKEIDESIARKLTEAPQPLDSDDEPLDENFRRDAPSDYIFQLLRNYGFKGDWKHKDFEDWFNELKESELHRYKLLSLHNAIADAKNPFPQGGRRLILRTYLDPKTNKREDGKDWSVENMRKLLKDAATSTKDREQPGFLDKTKTKEIIHDPERKDIPRSYFAWAPPTDYGMHLQTDSDNVHQWYKYSSGPFSPMKFVEKELIPSDKTVFEHLDAKVKRNQDKKHPRKPPTLTRLALFPDWDGVSGKKAITPENACNLDEDVALKSFLPNPTRLDKLLSPEQEKTLTSFVECRAPKLYCVIKLMRTKIKNASGGESTRNAAVYVPLEGHSSTDTLEFLKAIFVNLLKLQDLTDPDALEKIEKKFDSGESCLPQKPFKGYLFMVRQGQSVPDNKHNTRTKKMFSECSLDGRTNVLILAKRHYQSINIRGANCIFRLQPFSLGTSRQIIGRVHRNNAQIKYKTRQSLENYALLYKPSEKGSMLSCDTLIQQIYNITQVAEHAVEELMHNATLACKAMSALSKDLLPFPDYPCVFQENKHRTVLPQAAPRMADSAQSANMTAPQDEQSPSPVYMDVDQEGYNRELEGDDSSFKSSGAFLEK